MKYSFIFLIIISFFIQSGFSQNEKKFQISGKIDFLVGKEIIHPEKTFIQLLPTNKVETFDKSGYFEFNDLPSGKYTLRIECFGYRRLDTVISIQDSSVKNLSLLIIADCPVNKEVAEIDISNNEPRLLIAGGIAPVFYEDQEEFEQKYHIKYEIYGCVIPARECMEQYNTRIFEYLDSKYGKKWRKEVRKDVIGL